MQEISFSEAKKLGHKASETLQYYIDIISPRMTRDRALKVKELRAIHTYRGLADECYQYFGGIWDPPFNQLAGMALQKTASDLLNEKESSWNETETVRIADPILKEIINELKRDKDNGYFVVDTEQTKKEIQMQFPDMANRIIALKDIHDLEAKNDR